MTLYMKFQKKIENHKILNSYELVVKDSRLHFTTSVRGL